MTAHFMEAIATRRTYYAIDNQPLTSDDLIMELVGHAVTHSPSSFNSQSARVAVLLGDQHQRFWDLVRDELKQVVAPENFAATEEKLRGSFRSGYGTLLFFEDQQVVGALQERFPLYRDNFPIWSNQSSGMLQYAVWTALELEGWGASLQHYNPLVDRAVAAAWDIPATWKLIAQMPFGRPLAAPGPKEFLPLEQRITLFR